MLLKRFVNPEGKLYFFDRRCPEKGVLTGTPENLFVERHLYTAYDEDGIKDVSLEDYFAKLEGKVEPIVEKIVTSARAGRAPGLNGDEKATWDLFFYYQWKRVPDSIKRIDFLNNLPAYVEEVLAEFETAYGPITPEERRNLQDPEVLARRKQNATVKAIGDPGPQVLRVLGQKGLGIATIGKANKSFVIGSFPIVKLNLPGRAHLADPSVEAWLPVAPDVAVTPALAPGTERVVRIPEDRHIRGINEAIFKQSTLIAGRSRELIASLAGCR